MDIDTILSKVRFSASGETPRPSGRLNENGRLVLVHEYLKGTHYATTGVRVDMASDGSPSSTFLATCQEAMNDISRRWRRQELFKGMDPDVVLDRPWQELDRPPGWATLTHPLFAYALRMSGANDLSAEALAGTGEGPAPGLRVECIQDLVVGRSILDPAHPTTGKVGCDTAGATLFVVGDIPEKTRNLLRGHALSALIQLRSCGDAHLDGIVSSLPISKVIAEDVEPTHLRIEFTPIPWVACAEAPRGIDVSPMRREPPCR